MHIANLNASRECASRSAERNKQCVQCRQHTFHPCIHSYSVRRKIGSGLVPKKNPFAQYSFEQPCDVAMHGTTQPNRPLPDARACVRAAAIDLALTLLTSSPVQSPSRHRRRQVAPGAIQFRSSSPNPHTIPISKSTKYIHVQQSGANPSAPPSAAPAPPHIPRPLPTHL